MRKQTKLFVITALLIGTWGCKNRDLHEGEGFQMQEIHENVPWHFDRIEVDAIEYLILEKDNNNPHEGFGFMAMRGNTLHAKQDSILVYLKTQQAIQIEILALLSRKSKEQVKEEVDQIFAASMKEYENRINSLNSKSYNNEASRTAAASKPPTESR